MNPTHLETHACGCVYSITEGTDGETTVKVCPSHASATFDVTKLKNEIVQYGIEKGWSFKEEEIPEKLMLAVGELSEAMEFYRTGQALDPIHYSGEKGDKPDGFTVELADALIRILHLAGRFNLPIEEAIRQKMDYNHKRPYRHGGLKA
jgi:NTP pyrophosphatase (non-canonical NTP hydrolase)